MSHAFRLLLSLVVALACGAAAAAAPASVFLEELTWTELRDQVKEGSTTVIVPIGGTEQNGPAMVLGKHNLRAKVLAGRIASGLGHTLVAPVVAYVPEGAVNPPTAHMRYAGTITIPDAAFETTLEYTARSLRQHGFKDIVLVGDHGGYQTNMKRVAERLNREWAHGPARVHALEDYYRAFNDEYRALLKGKGLRDDEIGTHAGLADVALSLAVDPQLVRSERLASTGAGEGATGDARRATAALGQLGADLIVGRSIEAIRRALARR
ncbi:MAG TPA: creatininase family protein [Albitalea sp.]|uniref:creatininase family protein n=1 Tax=Piscinibacter sp. TaxID=1903157 RepID=UPI002ED209A7